MYWIINEEDKIFKLMYWATIFQMDFVIEDALICVDCAWFGYTDLLMECDHSSALGLFEP